MTPPPIPANFRAHYRAERIPSYYSGRLHLGLTTSICLAVILWCAVKLESVTPLEWLAVPVTLLYANLSEYLGHRGPMHNPTKGLGLVYQRHTREHHIFFTDSDMAVNESRDFMAVLFPPVMLLFFTLAFALPVGLLLGWLASPNTAYLFVMTSLAYFLNYELLHLAYHLPESHWAFGIPFMKTLRRHHMTHHRPDLMSRYNFNITYPVADWFFGTTFRRDP